MLKNDGAIDKIEKDKLNRKDFIERIIEGISGYKDTDSLVIGLEGNWGSGKTSILNIIEKELKKQEVEVFKFNPWNFSIRKQLVSDFFEQFSLFLGSRSNTKEALKEVSKNLMKISYILKPITTITGVVPIVGNITKGIEELGKSYEQFSNIIDLETIKKDVMKALEERDEKIIIFIDDLDRLLDSEICEVLQFVKGIGDLKNIIYILAYDKQIVINSLDKITSNKGEEYLRKIVQIQMELPIITSSKIGFLFKDEIEGIFSNKIGRMTTSEMNYLCEVFEKILMYLPKNIRDLKRIMNNIRFSSKKSENLNLTDYIFIKTLEVTNYDIYKYIKNNKNDLVMSKKVILENTDKIGKFNEKDSELVINILSVIFEKRNNSINTNRDLEKFYSKRLCNDAYFYDYFGNEYKSNISRDVQTKLKNVDNEEEFADFLSNINDIETITEIFLNVEEFIFYKNYALTRSVYLMNLLESYMENNNNKFDNVIILKNMVREMGFNDCRNNNSELLDYRKLNMKSSFSLKIILDIIDGDSYYKDLKNEVIEFYIKKHIQNHTNISEFISLLREELEIDDKIYFVARIYSIKNDISLLLKIKNELLKIKNELDNYLALNPEDEDLLSEMYIKIEKCEQFKQVDKKL